MSGTSRLRWVYNAERRKGLRREGARGRRNREAMSAVRPVLLERSGGRCEADGFSPYCTGVGAHAHHIWPSDRDRGLHDPDRMALVCAPCHEHIHRYPGAAGPRGLLKKSWEQA